MNVRYLLMYLITVVPTLLDSSVACATDFVDAADDPPKYVGQTFTFLVWVEPDTISRERLEDSDGKTTHADGYIVVLEDGSKQHGKGDRVGNRFGFLSGKNRLNPFLDKELGRKLKDELEKGKAYTLKVTFTLKKVTQKQLATFDYYIAEISKVERP